MPKSAKTFQPLAFCIALRYLRAKKDNQLVSFTALISIIGIALGITVLITVMSVMNGFDYEIRNHLLASAKHITILGHRHQLQSWQSLAAILKDTPQIVASAPMVCGEGIISKSHQSTGVIIDGILPKAENQLSNLEKNMLLGSSFDLIKGKFKALISLDLANQLEMHVGDKVLLITPQTSLTLIGIEPRFKQFTVAGIFNAQATSAYHSKMVLINLEDAQKLLNMKDEITGFNLQVADLYQAPIVSKLLREKLSAQPLSISDWTNEYGPFFEAVRMEKTTMFVVLLFIILVATFNLVSSLVMTVVEKRSDIAILKTLGATPGLITTVFIIQGTVIGIIGIVLGVLGGVILSLNAPTLVSLLETLFHTQFISSGIYFINYLPSKLLISDLVMVTLAALAMSFFATIYPARQAAKIAPAVALRYE